MKNTTSDISQTMDFSSDDETYDNHPQNIDGEIQIRIQENTNSVCGAFKDFMSTPNFINSKGDITTNIVDRYLGKCYCIPPRKLSTFFKYLEILNKKKLKSMLNEKQLEYSGIMLDFDIKLDHGGQSNVGHTQYHRLCINVMRILLKYIHFPDADLDKKKTIHIGFTKKPKIVYDSENNYYKDGIHMLIPGIQITREFKKFLINTIIEDNILEKVFKEIVPHKTNTRSEFLDINSAHVPVFFIGSASKLNTPPYELVEVYNVQVTIGDSDDTMPVINKEFLDPTKNINICYEFSLNWVKNPSKGGIIEKIRYDIKPEHQNLLDQYKNKVVTDGDFDEESDKNYNDLSILNVHDPEMEYIKLLLDILHQKRSEDYGLWFDVLCALAHTSQSYKPLGEYFSKKSIEKFDLDGFEKIWDSISTQKSNKLSIGSIHYWAKLDNPDRYEEVRHRSLFTLVFKNIYDPQVEGVFEHYDIAEILYQVLKNKFVYDKAHGVSKWYEFILENEPMQLGEMYKWRVYNDRPNSLMKYISTILPVLFRKVLDRIKSTLEDSNTEFAKYHYSIYKAFQKTCRTLKNNGFKHSVGKECEQLFERMGFSETLDNDPNLKGVANGILQLGKKCKLIQGYHGHAVSKYTNARYKKMNPRDEITKKVIVALRNLFPDNEPDTFDYIMHYLASTLDGNKKESIMLLLVGKGSNGKSFMVELHKAAIGSSYGVKMPLSFLTSRAKDAESATPALMQLKDAHFAYYSESNKFEVLNMAKIKEFTGQETLAGRNLHSDYINFKPKCHHLVASNNDFEIMGTDHGTWRRIDYVTMKIKFCAVPNDEYDPKNPYERIADPSLGSHWADDELVLEAYLGFLAYYYESLHNNYGGKVRNVPHPHIRKETEDFRNRQDRVNNFLNMSLVRCEDPDSEIPITDIVDKFTKWYESQFPGSNGEYKRHAKDNIENSKIQSYIKKTRMGNYLKGYRVLGIGESKTDDEEYYIDLHEHTNINKLKIKSENAAAYIERLCNEYDLSDISNIKVNDEKCNRESDNKSELTDVDSDAELDEMIKTNKSREPNKFNTKNKFNKLNSYNETEKNGIKLHKKRETVKTTTSVVELKEYANMGNDSDTDDSDAEKSNDSDAEKSNDSDTDDSDDDK
jgi:phage/plasmid-associated DNA primase